jgi:hypothetical protein
MPTKRHPWFKLSAIPKLPKGLGICWKTTSGKEDKHKIALMFRENEYQKSSFEPGVCITSLSLVICSPYLTGDPAPTISSQVVATPSNMSIHICLTMRGGDNTALQDAVTPLQTFYVHGSTTSRQNQETLLLKLL